MIAHAEQNNEAEVIAAEPVVPIMENGEVEAHDVQEAAQPHISIKGEEVFTVGGFHVTNSILTTTLVVLGFILLANYYYQQYKSKDRSLFFYAMNGLIKFMYDLMHGVLHKKINFFFPLLGSFFFFILLNNWSGLIPGVGSILIDVVHEGETHHIPLFRGGTADLNTTFALAAVSVFATQIFGFQYLGPVTHLGKYFNFKDPVMLFVGILELILEAARILSFAFRLFGNIFAGEVLLTIVPFLLPVALSFVSSPMYFMEIFVGFVQALVFVILSTIFINMAVSHDH